MIRSPLLVLLLLGLGVAAARAQVTITYTYPNTAPNGYVDSGGSPKLTDGVGAVAAWAPDVNPDVNPFVGWSNHAATIRFQFSQLVRVTGITLWLADSDGHAGVHLPDEIMLRNDDSSRTETFAVANPPGAGTTVALSYSLAAFDTDHVVVTAWNPINPQKEWIMFTEVQFTYAAIPEPSAYAVGLGAAVLAGTCWFRRRSSAARPRS